MTRILSGLFLMCALYSCENKMDPQRRDQFVKAQVVERFKKLDNGFSDSVIKSPVLDSFHIIKLDTVGSNLIKATCFFRFMTDNASLKNGATTTIYLDKNLRLVNEDSLQYYQ